MEGPGEIYLTIRTFIWEHWRQHRWIEKGISCPHCIAFSVVAPITALAMVLQLHYEWYAFLWLWPALAGVASFMYDVGN